MIENLHIRVKHVRGKLEAILTRPGQKVAFTTSVVLVKFTGPA
jgi:hypothetical protein